MVILPSTMSGEGVNLRGWVLRDIQMEALHLPFRISFFSPDRVCFNVFGGNDK